MKVEIIRSNRKSISIEVCPEGYIKVKAPLGVTQKQIKQLLAKRASWIEKHLRKIQKEQQYFAREEMNPFTPEEKKELTKRGKAELIPRTRQLAEALGLSEKLHDVRIKLQKSRFGSCSGKGNINLNAILVLAPKEVSDYVIIHELCHLKQMNHSALFWEEVKKAMPEYQNSKRWLKDYGGGLIRRL